MPRDGPRRRWVAKGVDAITNDTTSFLERFAASDARTVLGSARGSIRFDLRDGRRIEHRRVELRRDEVVVSESDAPADCVLRADRAVFDDIVEGRLSAMPALLRGLVDVEGDAELLVRFQRVFPVVARRPDAASSRTVGKRRG